MIVERIIQNRLKYEERNKKKEAKELELLKQETEKYHQSKK